MTLENAAIKPMEEPNPSAREMGRSALLMITIATEKGTLQGALADEFRQKANEIRISGAEISAQFAGAAMMAATAHLALHVTTDGCIDAHVADKMKAACEYGYWCGIYLQRRTELQRQLDALWAELQTFKKPPKRTRGGQRGRRKHPDVDSAIHLQTLINCFIDGHRRKLTTYRREIVKSYISEGKLSELGGIDTNNSLAAHVKRLNSSWPSFITATAEWFDEWKLNQSEDAD